MTFQERARYFREFRSSLPRAQAARIGSLLLVLLGGGALVAASVSSAAEGRVGLGTANSFAVLAAAGVTNTGTTVISGDLGTCPTPAITGAPAVINGAIHANDDVACQAQADLVTAYDDAAGRAPTTTYTVPTDLGGLVLTPGVYQSSTSFGITGTLTLDPGVETDPVFIFQAGSTLITEVGSRVVLLPGVNPCNVFWQVGSSAVLKTGSTFVGTILALSDISAGTNATVEGRLLARNAITLDSNVITRPLCEDTTTTTSPPTDTSTTLPGDTSTTLPAGTSTTLPADTSTTLPADTSTTLPADTSTTLPAGTSTTLPADTSTTLPAGTSTTLPAGTSTTLPADTSTTVSPTGTTIAASQTGTTLAPGQTSTTALSGVRSSTGATATTTNTGSTTATTARSGGSASNSGGGRTLATTGPSIAWAQTVALAALGMAMGGLMVVLARREQ